MKLMKNELMSSEESDDNETVVVKPLPWRSEYVDKIFHTIDKYTSAKKSSQAKRQTKSRNVGSASLRMLPQHIDLPAWALATSSS